ncbi:MurR/RpiR family transcriptional regulator [Siccirubricoccus sp. KC 17139]|uniref:MurR/RpiR family transcriptional regulator n=1 Tax=Siccirubricoccus soli TaxID=2899147 RepID=A0ABT1CZ19_9PROT|nr:MurR/RpiR family transcriptional regulator [Siccirubricoccus soli]MCO6414647.1 MurR/RpiR family transcriptional regulator [Siccirubricoccus soli]MCP2680777.1 MurR/RpiR family transcriptional regulator [Siccirubricoccus soli]
MSRSAPTRLPRDPIPSGGNTPPLAAIERLRALRSGLPPTAARIADLILSRQAEVVHMSVTEVAEHAGASEGSVIALCRQVGARGFQHLKIELARALTQPVQAIHEDLEPGDAPATVMRKVFAAGIQALQDTLAVLDPAALARAASLLCAAKRIEVYGIGSAAPVAEDAHMRMLRIGLDVRLAVDSHVQAVSAALAGPKVATLTISHSGSSVETITATRLAREAGARTVIITNLGRNPLQAHADVVLSTAARETRFRTEAMTSRIAQLAVVDALISSMALARGGDAILALRRSSEVLSLKRY